jgi:hypothetical protein
MEGPGNVAQWSWFNPQYCNEKKKGKNKQQPNLRSDRDGGRKSINILLRSCIEGRELWEKIKGFSWIQILPTISTAHFFLFRFFSLCSFLSFPSLPFLFLPLSLPPSSFLSVLV